MNYKVILADDEEEALRGIHKILDWKSYGFEVVETFSNGRDVLDFLEAQEADLVITDIRMPFMDGIELSKKISEQYPNVKVIIISGYGDFQYAKEAMSFHVMDYILKPVNAKEMGDVLQRAKETLCEELEERKNINILKRQYEESLPVIRDHLLNRLVSGDAGTDGFFDKLKRCGIRVADASFWMVVLFRMDASDGRTEEMEETYALVYVRNLLGERFGALYNYAIFYSRFGECAIFGMKKREEAKKILLQLNGIAKESKKVMGICLSVGAGKIKDDLLELKASLEEAKEALMYRKMAEEGQVVYMEDIGITDQNYVFLDEGVRDMLFSVIKFGDEEGIRSVLRGIQEQLKKQDMNINGGQVFMVSMLYAVLLFVKQYIPSMERDFFGKRVEVFDLIKIGQYGEADAFFRWLEDCCLSLGAYFAQQRDSKAQRMTDIAKKYIQKEYGNPDISLESAAEYIGLTPAYFSSVFKKETGETFVEYVTRIRLEEAKRLLDETDEKIYAIAERMGYVDAGYFSHVFKKKYGMSPIGYRRKNQ